MEVNDNTCTKFSPGCWLRPAFLQDIKEFGGFSYLLVSAKSIWLLKALFGLAVSFLMTAVLHIRASVCVCVCLTIRQLECRRWSTEQPHLSFCPVERREFRTSRSAVIPHSVSESVCVCVKARFSTFFIPFLTFNFFCPITDFPGSSNDINWTRQIDPRHPERPYCPMPSK